MKEKQLQYEDGKNQHFVKGMGWVDFCAHATPKDFKGHRDHPPRTEQKDFKIAKEGFDEEEARRRLSR